MSCKEEDDDDVVCLEDPWSPVAQQAPLQLHLPIRSADAQTTDTNQQLQSILIDDIDAANSNDNECTMNYTQECEHNCNDDIPTCSRALSPDVVSISDDNDDDIDYLMRNKDILEKIDAVPLHATTKSSDPVHDDDDDVLLIEIADKVEKEMNESRCAILPIRLREPETASALNKSPKKDNNKELQNENMNTLNRFFHNKTYDKSAEYANKKRLRDSIEFEMIINREKSPINSPSTCEDISPKRQKTNLTLDTSPSGLLVKLTENRKKSPNIQRQTSTIITNDNNIAKNLPKSPSLTPTSRQMYQQRSPPPSRSHDDEQPIASPVKIDASQRTVFKSLFGFNNVDELSSTENSADEQDKDEQKLKNDEECGEPAAKQAKIETKNMNFIKKKLIERANFMSKFSKINSKPSTASHSTKTSATTKYAEFAKKNKNHELAAALLAKSKASAKNVKNLQAPLQNTTTLSQGIRIAKAELNARKLITEARNNCIESAKVNNDEDDDSDEDNNKFDNLKNDINSKSVAMKKPPVLVDPQSKTVNNISLKKDEFLVNGIKHTKTAGFAKPISKNSAPVAIPVIVKKNSVEPPRKAILIEANSIEMKAKSKHAPQKDLVTELIKSGCMKEPSFQSNNLNRENSVNNVSASASEQCRYMFEDFLFRILKWSFYWLIEQEKCAIPPPIVSADEITPVLDMYSKYDDYYKTMFPLLLLETWEEISYSWREANKSKMAISKPTKCWLIERQYNKNSTNLVELRYHILIDRSDKSSSVPNEDDILKVTIDVKENVDPKSATVASQIFGLVKRAKKIKSLEDPAIAPGLKNYLKSLKNEKHKKNSDNGIDSFEKHLTCYEIVTIVRARKYSNEPSLVFETQSITNLSSSFRRIKSLITFKNLPYHLRLLNPNIIDTMFTCQSNDSQNKNEKQPENSPYNESQSVVISEASKLVSFPALDPKFYFIQGPPGTGKSHTIVGIIKAIFKHLKNSKKKGSNEEPMRVKIFVCSPSNGGCDELARRLKVEIDRTNLGIPLREVLLVRVGRTDQIHRDCSEFTLDFLARKKAAQLELDDKSRKTESLNSNYENLKQTERNLREKLMISKQQGEEKVVREYELKLDDLLKRKANFEKMLKSNSAMSDGNNERRAKETVIREADIIVSTLNFSGNQILDCLCREQSKSIVNVIIIDEAAQCLEVDCLIPLRFGCNKVILVGDPEQLPATVLSKRAQENGLMQSLFERIYQRFKFSDYSPIRMLYVQYRMHPDICAFPSEQFYAGKLLTSDETAQKRSKLPVKHFLFFNLLKSQEIADLDSNSVSNEVEAQFILNLCKYLSRRYRECNIGIITPYQKQMTLLRKIFQKNGMTKYDIGTVDGFQGREKDIILFSCVRAKNESHTIGFLSHRQRLNVALTRAKYALFIAGNAKSLQINENWNACVYSATKRNMLVDINGEIDRTEDWDKIFGAPW